jgi:carbon monoxide dehydrogenase subunit G
MEYVRLTQEIARPPNQVWREVADFGGIVRWVDGVTECVVTGQGVGAVRLVTRNGRQIRERLATWDPREHVLAYELLPPHALPASDIRSTLALSGEGERTLVTWRSEARIPGDAAVLRGYIEPFFRTSLSCLRQLLEQS